MHDPVYLSGPGRARRPNVMARHHVVVSGHYYASLAGLQILEAGGNAIDAGVATGLAIDVLESQFVGFGGVAPIMIHLAGGETHVISGVGVWPKSARLEYFQQNGAETLPAEQIDGVKCKPLRLQIDGREVFGLDHAKHVATPGPVDPEDVVHSKAVKYMKPGPGAAAHVHHALRRYQVEDERNCLTGRPVNG